MLGSPSSFRSFLAAPTARVGAPVLWAAVIFVVSSIPGRVRLLPPIVPHIDKLAHGVEYAILGALIFRAGRGAWRRAGSVWWPAVCLVLGSLYGAGDEWHQAFVPDRSASVADWACDTAGAALGVLALFGRERRGP